MQPDEFDAELTRRLERFTAPAPDPADTAALVEQLRPLIRGARPAAPPRFRATGLYQEPLAATMGWLTAQAYLFHPAFWAASALLLLVGTLALSAAAGTGLSQALALAAPLPAALGVAYAFRTASGSAELELACPISPVQVVLGRTLLVLGYNLALGIPAAWAARWLAPDTAPALGAMLLGWLAPLLLLTGLTLCLTTLVGIYPGVAGGLAVWAVQVLWLSRPEWAAPMRRLALYRSPADEGWLATQVGALALGALLLAAAHMGARRLALNGPEGR